MTTSARATPAESTNTGQSTHPARSPFIRPASPSSASPAPADALGAADPRRLGDGVLEVALARLLLDEPPGDGTGRAELALGARVEPEVAHGEVPGADVAVAAQRKALHGL